METNLDRISGRAEAGKLLAVQLKRLGLANAVVVGIPPGGVVVAAAVAESLSFPLEVMPCREFKDPLNQDRTISSISENSVVMHDRHREVPGSVAYYQVMQVQNEIRFENHFYYGDIADRNFFNRAVIVVTDVLPTSDAISAVVSDIRSYRPAAIIVAAAMATDEAVGDMLQQCDGVFTLRTIAGAIDPALLFRSFPPVDDWTVRQMLERSPGHHGEESYSPRRSVFEVLSV